MGRTFQLFWNKGWDNLIHIVVLNLIWFTLTIPLVISLWNLAVLYAPEPTALESQGTEPVTTDEAEVTTTSVTGEVPAAEAPSAALQPTDSAVTSPSAATPAQPTDSAVVLPPALSRREPPTQGRLVASIVFAVSSWILFCIGSGFVFFSTADIVKEYDFSGYRHVLLAFLRGRIMATSVVSISLSTVAAGAAVFNLAFYLHLAQTRGIPFLLLAGLVLWFLMLVTMSFALVLPLVAQREMTFLRALRTAALLSLSSPLRTALVVAIAGGLFFVGLLSGAGAGFFAMGLPAVLLNSEARARLEGIEGPGTSASVQE